jgi:hypothetical protein
LNDKNRLKDIKDLSKVLTPFVIKVLNVNTQSCKETQLRDVEFTSPVLRYVCFKEGEVGLENGSNKYVQG